MHENIVAMLLAASMATELSDSTAITCAATKQQSKWKKRKVIGAIYAGKIPQNLWFCHSRQCQNAKMWAKWCRALPKICASSACGACMQKSSGCFRQDLNLLLSMCVVWHFSLNFEFKLMQTSMWVQQDKTKCCGAVYDKDFCSMCVMTKYDSEWDSPHFGCS